MTLLDGWLDTLSAHHHYNAAIEMRTAKDIAKQWRLGWYVAPNNKKWEIGKMTIGAPYRRFAIVRDDGVPLHFPNVDEALTFYRTELGVFGVAMFA